MAIGMSQYAKWAATPEGATAILKKYQAPDEREGQTANSPEPTSQDVKLMQALNEALWKEPLQP
jgi:hypothetical protein